MKVTDWINDHSELWRLAVVHPFLDECASGTISDTAFNRWLVQDRLFVVEFTRFAGQILKQCPLEHMDVLLGGLVALRDELQWFVVKGEERTLKLDVPLAPACSAYVTLMRRMCDETYAVQATAFWAIERAYNEAWKKCGPMPPPYNEFADRWGNDGFTAYVDQLAVHAGEALARADQAAIKRAKEIFLEIARLEKDFWQMAYAD